MNYKSEIKKIYTEAFHKYGDDNRSCLWGEEESMNRRYEELFHVGIKEESSILDVGCGIGGFYEYLTKHCGIKNVKYQGIDIVKEMIEMASKKYPEVKFETRDILTDPILEKYEYVVLGGLFNIKAGKKDDDFMKQMLIQSFKCCSKAMKFNFISTYTNFRSEGMVYHSPQEMLTFCIENISNRVTLNHHYEKCDVSITVYQ